MHTTLYVVVEGTLQEYYLNRGSTVSAPLYIYKNGRTLQKQGREYEEQGNNSGAAVRYRYSLAASRPDLYARKPI